MYLHVGNNRNIRISSVIGIFDMDNSTISMITRKFLGGKQKQMLVESVSDEIPKSFVVSCENGTHTVCFSQLSVTSLMGRAENGYENNFIK